MIRFSPVPDADCDNCFCDCHLADDDFNRASLGADWTVQSGSWSIVSDVLRTSSANAVVTYTTTRSTHVVQVQIRAAAASAKARIIVGWTDANNYAWVEVEWPASGNCGTLRLGEVISGTSSDIATAPLKDLELNTWYWLSACFGSKYPSGNQLSAVINHVMLIEDTNASGSTVGLGTGNSTATTEFDNFALWKHRDDDNPQCPTCTGGCKIAEDDLDAALDACVWDEVAGTWSYDATAAAVKTSSTSAKARHKVPNPLKDGTGWVRVWYTGSAGDFVSVFGDANAGMTENIELRAKLSSESAPGVYNTDGALYLYQDGTLQLSLTSLAIPQTGRATLCIAPDGQVRGTTENDAGGDQETIQEDLTPSGHEFAGMGTGPTVSSAVFFRHFEYYRHYDASTADVVCPACPTPLAKCDDCCDQTQRPPAELILTATVNHTNGPCDGCSSVGGSYVLELDQGGDWDFGFSPPDELCGWQFWEKLCDVTHIEPLCQEAFLNITVWIEYDGGADACFWKARMELDTYGGICHEGSYALYELELVGALADCNDFPVTLTRDTESTPTGDPLCNSWSWPASITLSD